MFKGSQSLNKVLLILCQCHWSSDDHDNFSTCHDLPKGFQFHMLKLPGSCELWAQETRQKENSGIYHENVRKWWDLPWMFHLPSSPISPHLRTDDAELPLAPRGPDARWSDKNKGIAEDKVTLVRKKWKRLLNIKNNSKKMHAKHMKLYFLDFFGIFLPPKRGRPVRRSLGAASGGPALGGRRLGICLWDQWCLGWDGLFVGLLVVQTLELMGGAAWFLALSPVLTFCWKKSVEKTCKILQLNQTTKF